MAIVTAQVQKSTFYCTLRLKLAKIYSPLRMKIIARKTCDVEGIGNFMGGEKRRKTVIFPNGDCYYKDRDTTQCAIFVTHGRQ